MKKRLITISLFCLFTYSIFAQWPSDPMENLAVSTMTGEQAIPKVASSETGTTYIAWFSNEGNYNVRLQKLDVFGNTLWEEDGLLISDHPAMTWLTDWDMTVDHTDHAILTFQDIRNGNNDIFAYRISPDGEFVWGDDGLELSNNAAFDAAPKVCVSAANNVFIAWQAEALTRVQKISPEGSKFWGDEGIEISTENTISWPQLMPVGDDDVIVKFFEDTPPTWSPTRHIYAQRFDVNGDALWTDPTAISSAGGISAWSQIFRMIHDGEDGFYIVWDDDRDNNNLTSSYIQHVSAEGEILLGANGTEISTMSNRNHFYPFLALPEGSENVYVYWNEQDGNQNLRGIYGQKISPTGERLWTDNGKSIIEISADHVLPFSASGADQNMVVLFEASIDVLNAKVKAMSLDLDGNFVWENNMIELCGVSSEKVHTDAGKLMSGQWIVSWEDSRNGGKDIYAQNLKLDGTLGPVSMGGEFEIQPDSLVFDVSEALSLYLINNTLEVVTIEELYFTDWYCFFEEDPPALPYDINPGDSLTLVIMHNMIVNTPQNYIIEYLNIVTSGETYVVTIYVNEDLIGSVSDLNINSLTLSPNPSASVVQFEFNNQLTNAVLNILDQNGRLVRQFNLNGDKSILWDVKNEFSQRVQAGTYFYQLISQKTLETGKIIILK